MRAKASGSTPCFSIDWKSSSDSRGVKEEEEEDVMPTRGPPRQDPSGAAGRLGRR